MKVRARKRLNGGENTNPPILRVTNSPPGGQLIRQGRFVGTTATSVAQLISRNAGVASALGRHRGCGIISLMKAKGSTQAMRN